MATDPPRSPRSPRDYRPDLRPIAIVVLLLMVVIVGWLVLSPLILPAAQ